MYSRKLREQDLCVYGRTCVYSRVSKKRGYRLSLSCVQNAAVDCYSGASHNLLPRFQKCDYRSEALAAFITAVQSCPRAAFPKM